MGKYKIVVTDYNFENIEPEKEQLSRVDADIFDYHFKTEEEADKAVKDADAIMSISLPITDKMISNLSNCKIIARYSVGIDNIDIKSATEHGICVTNVPGYCADEVSDHTIMLLLASIRKFNYVANSVKEGIWDYKISKPVNKLRGKKLGLIGFGNIPRLVAQKIKPFGVEVIAYDPYVNKDSVNDINVKMGNFEDILEQCDFISIHAPLTDETRHMFNEEAFLKMKKKPYLINTARGAIIDENDLIRALENGSIKGAALDVVEKEPISKYNPLLSMDNVIITPHCGWYSEEAEKNLQIEAAKQVASVLSGYYPENLVNTEVKSKLNLK